MAITAKQKKHLRSLAHHLNPVVMIGHQGVSESVLKEIDRGLGNHELIKIKVACEDQEEFRELTEEIVAGTQAELVQVIGHTVVLYRRSKDEPVIELPR